MRKNPIIIIAIVGVLFIAGYFLFVSREFSPNYVLSMEYDDLHGLWGGHLVKVAKDGSVGVDFFKGLGEPGVHYDGKISEAEAEVLMQVFVDNNFSNIRDVELSRIPDASSVTIRVLYSDGGEQRVTQSFNDRTPEIKAIGDEFLEIAEQIKMQNTQ